MIYFLAVSVIILAVALGVVGALLFTQVTTPEREPAFIKKAKEEPTGNHELSNFLSYDGTKQE